MIAYGILIREIKIPPTHICVIIIVMHEVMWLVVDDKTYLITCCVICCAKCHFLPFLPSSSISQPPSWKMLPVSKTPENSTLRAYQDKIGMIPIMIVKYTLVN